MISARRWMERAFWFALGGLVMVMWVAERAKETCLG